MFFDTVRAGNYNPSFFVTYAHRQTFAFAPTEGPSASLQCRQTDRWPPDPFLTQEGHDMVPGPPGAQYEIDCLPVTLDPSVSVFRQVPNPLNPGSGTDRDLNKQAGQHTHEIDSDNMCSSTDDDDIPVWLTVTSSDQHERHIRPLLQWHFLSSSLDVWHRVEKFRVYSIEYSRVKVWSFKVYTVKLSVQSVVVSSKLCTSQCTGWGVYNAQYAEWSKVKCKISS